MSGSFRDKLLRIILYMELLDRLHKKFAIVLSFINEPSEILNDYYIIPCAILF
jgi:hypothetical protein